MKRILIDTCTDSGLVLRESASVPGKYHLSGKFGHVDRPTDNQRVYFRKYMEGQIRTLAGIAKEGALFGELDHPEAPTTALSRCAILIRELRIDAAGNVLGEADVMDTDAGRNLKAIMDAGGRPGISSRGRGSVKVNSEGIEEVQDDFELDTYDVVARPAVADARPRVFTEEIDVEKIKSLDELRQAFPEMLAQVETSAREDERRKAKVEADTYVKATLGEQVEKLAEEARVAVREELLEDPEVAKAKTVLEAIKGVLVPFGLGDAADVVKGLNEQISNLKAEVEAERAERIKAEGLAGEAAQLAQGAAMLVHLSRHVRSSKHGAQVWESLQGVAREVATVEELDRLIGEVEQELLDEAKFKAESDERIAVLEQKNAELTRALGRAIDVGNELEESLKNLEARQTERSRREALLASHPRREEASELIAAAEALDSRRVENALQRGTQRGSRLYQDVQSRRRSPRLAEDDQRCSPKRKPVNPDDDDTTEEGLNLPFDEMLNQL